MKKRSNTKKLAFFFGVLILVPVFLISGFRILEPTVSFPGENQGEAIEKKTITRNGVDYFPRQDITVLMILGIDDAGSARDSGNDRNPGMADLVALVIFDEKAQMYDVLYLNRDTMLDVPVPGMDGKQAGSSYGQLALAHSYGSGLEDSCENTVKAVSDFLGGIRIDYYMSVPMDAIAMLNDAVGGVRVLVKDDFSEVDPTITMGEMILRGDQAISFLRTRQGLGEQLNISRIQRLEVYIDGFMEAFRRALDAKLGFAVNLFEQVDSYMVSNCPVSTLYSMISHYEGYKLREFVTPEGENDRGAECCEFYADEEKLDELILRLFYAPK